MTGAERIFNGVIVQRNIMVPMRDGVRLATDVYLPEGADGPLPAILERTPYDKSARSRSEIEIGMTQPMTRAEVAAQFVRAGFAVIYQDCRGRHRSEGQFVKYLAEAPDGFDTIGWIAGQTWCNGDVGTMGLSYAAHAQMAAACLAPPALRTMVLDSGGFSNAFTCGIRQGGAFELKQATWAYNQAREAAGAAGDVRQKAALESENLHHWFASMPWSTGASPIRWSPEYEAYLLEQWGHEIFDEYWKQPGLYAAGYYDQIPDIPVMLMSSWYDAYVRTTFENYAGLARRPDRPLAVVMGPGLHGNRNTTFAGDIDFGAGSTFGGQIAPGWVEYRLRWFDRWLKGRRNGIEHEARLRLFLMGGGSGRRNAAGRMDHGGRWIEAGDWPPREAREMLLYAAPDGRLADAPVPGAAPVPYDFDPANPVPTIGGALTSGQPIFEGGGFDQREADRFFGASRPGLPLIARRDVLSFETLPLDEDVAVVGPVIVELSASSDAPDTDFTAKLVDVYPPSEDYPAGYALCVTDGIMRAKFRHSFENPEPVQPGDIMRLVIEPFATANLFARGHRIRLDISSSNFPKYDVNPNTGAPAATGRQWRVARNMLHLAAETPSLIRLNVLPAGKRE